nr:immunoglobulin heavy chain junction region [Macaca mulatta]MOW19148.1 immunoglobulin heavy chain junction region [Macaca mulatta]MOW19581.1 immunoglobulin heavy chain junction region [Macaca mulatta]MOW19624.1 immunoglobulin heavy chain junction region [Macaca mulatta]MOW20128.1 immunoglobulin heavy chain junction region [Macaca mulatta]
CARINCYGAVCRVYGDWFFDLW